MLEDAETVLKRIDASLATSRPKLPVIENMPESERTQVLDQIQKLVSLKATVLALLPAFLAMTGTIEPAKRVKIMICMFDDQLALVPKRQCILRASDLEKLKTQMTRCIGFVRVNDDRLAQQIVAKASQSMAQKATRQKQEDTRAPPAEQPAKRARHADTTDDFEIVATRSPKADAETARSGPRTRSVRTRASGVSPTTPADPTEASTPGTKSDKSAAMPDTAELFAAAIKQAEDTVNQEQTRYAELAMSSPIDFVKKTWNELVATGQQVDKSKPMTRLKSPSHAQLDDLSVLSERNTKQYLFALINAPYSVGGDFQDMLALGAPDQDASFEPKPSRHGLDEDADFHTGRWSVKIRDWTWGSGADTGLLTES